MSTAHQAFEDPIARFREALARAQASMPYEARPEHPSSLDPTAMTLATVDADGQPSARIVLLKAFDERGFVFYTNRTSRKGLALAARPRAALLFFWTLLAEQVRIEGSVEQVSDEESDAYFRTRPRDSQIGAWASLQSETLSSRDELVGRIREIEARFANQPVPRPAHWGGYRVQPTRIEFWKEGLFRLHERDVYERPAAHGPWMRRTLYP